MIEDPIVEEVRRHRLARAARFNFDIDAIADDARKREGKSGHKVVQPPRKSRNKVSKFVSLRKRSKLRVG